MKKNVFIMGDSYSTYAGYIPEGYYWYYEDGRMEAPVVRGVDKTWWRILAAENDLNIVLNDSFSGSTLCNSIRPGLSFSSSFINRMEKYIAENFFAENEIDTIIIFGGTNDSWIDSPVGKVQYSDWTTEDLEYVVPGFCYLINRAKSVAKNVIAIVNSELKEDLTEGFIEASANSGIKCVYLKDIDKENGHPTEKGMRQIADQVAKYLD